MLFPEPARLTESTVLRALVVGFALVVILLGIAGLVAVKGAQAIEDDTEQVVREQLVVARLLNDVQAEQNTLAAILHQLAHMPATLDRAQLLADLQSADNAVARMAASAAGTPEAALWRELERTVRGFSAGVRATFDDDSHARPDAVARLLTRHDDVVRVEQELLDSSERRVAETQHRLEAESRQLSLRSRVLLGSCFALALLCAALTITFARRSIRRMEWQAGELSRVSWHMLQSQETAARRFSHELHDELGQSLAAVKANLTSTGAADWSARRADCIHLVDGAIDNVRELSQLLRPVILDDFGLDAGLSWLIDRFGERTGLRTNYRSSFHHRLPDETETHLFRLTQEALTNIARHSGATEVTVGLHLNTARVHLSIADNGCGLSPAQSNNSVSVGMTGMRARAEQVGGSLTLSQPPGGGLRIDVLVPWVPRLEHHADHQENPHPVG